LSKVLLKTKGSKILSRTLCVDLGCGTGLGAQQIRKRCKGKVFGIDLSLKMLKEARKKKGIYDSLECGDAVHLLRKSVEPQSTDLILSTDAVNYMFDLDDLFDAASSRLSPEGLFAFSTETATMEQCNGKASWVKHAQTGRISHTREYLAVVLERHPGLELACMQQVHLRKEGDSVVMGDLTVLRRRRDVA